MSKEIDIKNITQALKPYSKKNNFKINIIVEGENSYRIALKTGKLYQNIPYTRVIMIAFEANLLIIAIDKEDIQDLLNVSKMLPKT